MSTFILSLNQKQQLLCKDTNVMTTLRSEQYETCTRQRPRKCRRVECFTCCRRFAKCAIILEGNIIRSGHSSPENMMQRHIRCHRGTGRVGITPGFENPSYKIRPINQTREYHPRADRNSRDAAARDFQRSDRATDSSMDTKIISVIKTVVSRVLSRGF